MKNPYAILRICLTVTIATLTTAPIGSQAFADDVLLSENVPLVVQIHADWCRTCKTLEPTWTQIRGEFGDQSRILKLDVSDREAYEASLEKAKLFEIEAFFLKHRQKTGTIAVFDCTTREPVALLRGELGINKYRKAIALAWASC